MIANQNITSFFGKEYVQRSIQFQFERGERVTIKQLVSHVKLIVETEGYDRFKYKVSKRTLSENTNKSRRRKIDTKSSKKIVNDALQIENNTISPIDETLYTELKASLYKRVKTSLEQYSVDNHFLETLDDNIVEVFKKDNKIYGRIICVICRENNAQEPEPKSVSFYESKKSCYWILSNFIGHLKKHGYKPQDGVKMKRLKLQKKPAVINNDVILSDTENIEIIDVSVEDASVMIVNEENLVSKDIESEQLYNQFANQITEIVTENLNNGDAQEQINFKLNQTDTAFLTATKINPNGDCALGSMIHQIHKYPVNSMEHENATKLLRAEICEHILKPENFESYKHTLEGYLSNKKKKRKMKDTTMECKAYVRNTLAQDGTWAGAEAIHAVSEIHRVNIIVFIEDDDYYIHSYNRDFVTTIAIAYRKGINNLDETEYNHYDSVSDMDTDTIRKVINSLSKNK